MILILAIETVQVAFCAWALSVTWRRWRVAERRRKDYQATSGNGWRGYANRLRSARESDRAEFQFVFLVVCALILAWRLTHLHIEVHWLGALLFHGLLIYSTSWAYRQTRKDRQSEGELSVMQDLDDRKQEQAVLNVAAIHAKQDTIQAGVRDANIKLDSAKDQQEIVARNLAETTAHIDEATLLVGVSAQELQEKVVETANLVKTDTTKALDTQTDVLTGTIEAAKIYTAEKAHEAFKEANEVNRKIAELQRINEDHGAVLRQLLQLIDTKATKGGKEA